MSIEVIKINKENLSEFPKETIYYFGPRSISCNEQKFLKYKDTSFEVLEYNARGNGTYVIKIFDEDNKQILENLRITSKFTWHAISRLTFETEGLHPLESKYFKHESTVNYRLYDVLRKLHLLVKKIKQNRNKGLSEQHMYAYLIFLFYTPNKKGKIRASDLSSEYNKLKKIHSLIDRQYTHHVHQTLYSRELIAYKALNRFANNEIDRLEKLKIEFYKQHTF